MVCSQTLFFSRYWWLINKNIFFLSFFSVSASFLLAVWFCIYTHAQLRILKFQDFVYQKVKICAQIIINEWRISKRSVVQLRRQSYKLRYVYSNLTFFTKWYFFFYYVNDWISFLCIAFYLYFFRTCCIFNL